MKKGIIIFSLIFIVLALALSLIVFAQRESNDKGKSVVNERIEQKMRVLDEEGNMREVMMRIEEKEEHGIMMRRFRVKDVEADSKLEISEETEGNRSRIRVKLSNGTRQEIKVMPDRAAAIAIERLKSLGFNIELREVIIGRNSSRAIYFVEANKSGRFLGIFKMKMKMHSEVDPETGNITRFRKPWWAFLVSGEENDETNGKVILCHIPPGDPASASTIKVGAPAMRAHLAHGDTLGACEGSPPQNETSPPQNTTDQNMTNQNITVNIAEGIGVNPTG